MKKFLLSVWEVAEVVIVASVSIFIIYHFIAQPFIVSGPSMQENFHSSDYLVVDELTYRFKSPAHGEVVVFHNPRNEAEFYIKRILGLPGEHVVVRNNKVFVNDAAVNETYLPENFNFGGNSCSYCDVTLAPDEYYVMGDNRPNSSDSRYWGPLKKSEIVGAVRLRFWPLADFKFYEANPVN